MKTRTFVSILILVLSVLIISEGCATDKKVTKEDYRFMEGTWINLDYDKAWRYAKVIRKPDRTYEEYVMSYSELPALKGEYTINDKWTDSEGNTFYKIIVTSHGASYYILSKIDKSGKVYEDVWSTSGMPTEVDTENDLYRIYYRQE